MKSLSFYQAIKPMLIISKIFGTISFSFREKTYKISKLHYWHQIITIIGYLIILAYSIHFQKGYIWYDLLVTMITLMARVVTSSVLIIIWTICIYFQKKTIIILLKIQQIDKEMQKLCIWISYNKLNKTININIAFRFTLCVFLNIVIIIKSNYLENFKTIQIIISIILYYIPILVNTALYLEISTYILILKNRFEILNEHLTTLESNAASLLINDIKIIKLNSFLGIKLKKLSVICTLHHELTKLSEMVNRRFGFVLLMSFLNTFVIIVINLYLCSAFLNSNDISTKITSISGVLLNCGTYFLETFYICYVCSNTVYEANKSGTLIHKIETDENNVKNQIAMFSLQIAHNRVEFSAGGLFPINYSLIFSFIGGVTANLIILIQFSKY